MRVLAFSLCVINADSQIGVAFCTEPTGDYRIGVQVQGNSGFLEECQPVTSG